MACFHTPAPWAEADAATCRDASSAAAHGPRANSAGGSLRCASSAVAAPAGRPSSSIASRRRSARRSHDPMRIFFPRRLSCRAVPLPHGRSAAQGRSPRRQGRRSGGARTYVGPGSMHALGGRTSVLASFRRGLHGPHRRPDQLQSRQPAPVPCPAADSTPCAGRRCSLAPAETRGGPWAASHRAHCSRRARGARASCPEEAEVVEHDVGAACSHGRRAGATDAAHNRHSRKSQETSMGQFRHFA
jgi:hypothetical protein